MKRFLTLVACLLLLSAMSASALTVQNAENISDASQTYRITSLANGTIAVSAKNEPVIWEQPTLKAGEFMVRSSSLILHNATDKTQKLELQTVELPYDNEEALRYLDHLTITVTSGNTPLYNGPYSRINEDETFSIAVELPPDNQIAYNIQLSCDYQYTGNGFGAEDVIQWKFRTEAQADESEAATSNDSTAFANPVLLEVVVAFALTLLLLGGIMVYRYLHNR